jgi:hypothetical protein
MLVLALPVFAQPVDFAGLERYEQACVRLKAAILTDSEEDLKREDVVIGWITECNGNIPACRDARDAIREAKKGAPLDCLGRVQSHEAASAAYSLYLDKASKLPRCIERRC